MTIVLLCSPWSIYPPNFLFEVTATDFKVEVVLFSKRRRRESEGAMSSQEPALPKVSTICSLEEQVQDGKNRHLVRCQRCPSKILNPGMAVYKQVEFPLPYMKKKNDTTSSSEEEVVKDYWVVDDMYHFENVGFSNTIAGIKYLACADCEVGPIGWFDIAAKTSYVALSRVLHGNG